MKPRPREGQNRREGEGGRIGGGRGRGIDTRPYTPGGGCARGSAVVSHAAAPAPVSPTRRSPGHSAGQRGRPTDLGEAVGAEAEKRQLAQVRQAQRELLRGDGWLLVGVSWWLCCLLRLHETRAHPLIPSLYRQRCLMLLSFTANGSTAAYRRGAHGDDSTAGMGVRDWLTRGSSNPRYPHVRKRARG